MKFLLAAFSALLLLSGCASSIYQADISAIEKVPADHGFVAVSVVNNVEILAPLHPNWNQVWMVRIDNRDAKKAEAIAKARAKGVKRPDDEIDYDLDIYTLSPIAAGAISSQSFLGSMPAGEYRIGLLYSFYSDGNMSSSLSMQVGLSTGTFTVATNTLTELGSIVFQPLLTVSSPSFWTTSGAQNAYVTRGGELTDLRRFALESYPKLATRLIDDVQIGWDSDDAKTEQLRADLYQLSRANAFSNIPHRLTRHGKGAVTGRFGLLHYLDSDANWHTESLPTDGQLAALLEMSNEVIVGGEFGALFAAPSLAGPWQPIEAVNTRESIVWLAAGKTTNYALTQSAETFYLYRFDDIRSTWRRMHSLERKKSIWTGDDEILPFLTSDGGARILVGNKVHSFHPDTHALTITPAVEELINFAALGQGTLVGLQTSLWDGIGDQVVSIDDGASWQVFKRRLSIIGDNKADASLPTRLADGRFVTLGRRDAAGAGDDALYIVTAAAEQLTNREKHQYHGVTQTSCETLLAPLTHDNTLYFLCEQGGIIRTADLGQSYETLTTIDTASMQLRFLELLLLLGLEQ